jgi:hypothetical protein
MRTVGVQAAMAQGSLDNIPLGPLGTLMPLLHAGNMLQLDPIKMVLKQVPILLMWRQADCDFVSCHKPGMPPAVCSTRDAGRATGLEPGSLFVICSDNGKSGS